MDEGPRERLLRRGAGALSDGELLAVLLGTGIPGVPVTVLAARLVQRCGGLGGLIGDDPSVLLDEPGVGPAKLAVLLAAREVALRAAEEPLRRGDVMRSPQSTRRFLAQHLGGREREVFACLFLDAQHRLLRCEDLFFGTLDGAAVYPREVAARVLRYGAAAVILAHNHPSGVASPSAADRQITERLQRALALLDVSVLDHVVVGRGATFSFAEAGLL